MRTTLDLNDSLITRAKAEAARQRTTLTRLIEEGLALRLDVPAEVPEPREPFKLRVFRDGARVHPDTYADYLRRVAAAEQEDALWRAGLVSPRDPDDPA